MLGQHSFRSYQETSFTARDRKRAEFGPHAPRKNRFLAALSVEDHERLLPDLEPVPPPLGCTVHSAGDRMYFCTRHSSKILPFKLRRARTRARNNPRGSRLIFGLCTLPHRTIGCEGE